MFTVSLIGPDGVGKTTIARHLEATFPFSVRYLYMGLNPQSSNYMLPTTRWWEARKQHARGGSASRPPQRRAATWRAPLRAARKLLGLANRLLEEWYRGGVAWMLLRKGHIVVFDRHFAYDFYHLDPAEPWGRTLKRRIHGFLRRRTLPEPDLVICLDAPGAVVFARKGEFDPDYLEQRRQEYLDLGGVIRNFYVVDANRDLEAVAADVARVIAEFQASRWGGNVRVLHR
ncbi:MAG: hypothetical protein M3Z21_01200 [Pseudomonadota bacterium]|nr:hypothetical protein [Pseudomonadota bacterium]